MQNEQAPVHRIYVEKKPEYAVEAKGLCEEMRSFLGADALKGLRVLNRYDVQGVDAGTFGRLAGTVFAEPPLDVIHDELPAADNLLAVEYLPGQFDQRADSAAQCIQLMCGGERVAVRSAKVYLLQGALPAAQLAAIEKYLINPVEAQKAALEVPATLEASYPAPPPVPVLEGFCALEGAALPAFLAQYGLAMDEADLAFCVDYFKGENRDPSLTELRLIDTYWSDHCRHTTFGTVLRQIAITDEKTLRSYNTYLNLREELYAGRRKPQTLMDLATIGAKAIKAGGGLKNLDESDEVNACSVVIKADNGGAEEDWLLLFKNETHNHPTEIEPFGGAATCLGGAIRDPLANRGYVFGAMRVTGAGNPLVPAADTLPGKLPQRKLCTTAAAGYSSYGNQVGLATGQVTEIYHPGYIAKRMEIGAVLGAVPLKNVRREEPSPGDVVLLLGGDTGRDGCGGATGSSKAHDAGSLESCGAEVQKGNPPEERKLQRLFRSPEATRLIRRCNDFGAGGVAVAIGELADGLVIDLNAVPKKYDGLDGTELAISESQERMAVVVAAEDADRFIKLAGQENLKATRVAEVTGEKRLVMRWQGQIIVDISREFLSSNGAEKQADARVDPLPRPEVAPPAGNTLAEKLASMAADLNRCGQLGLTQRFDSTIGAASVLMPYGGKHQLTPAQAMVMKLPVDGETATCAGMAFGFDPFISEQNPYTGAYLAVVDSVAKLCASGFELKNITLTFQEYFERLRSDALRWGKPLAALLGALQAQLDLGVAAIGGKDSMSGSFEELDVPPTLVSFAVGHAQTGHIVSNEFQLVQSRVVWLRGAGGDGLTPSPASFKLLAAQLANLIRRKKVLAVQAVGAGGLAEALFKMGLGNRLGIRLAASFDEERLFAPAFGSFVVELAEDDEVGELLGITCSDYVLETQTQHVHLDEIQQIWLQKLEPVFPCQAPADAAAGAGAAPGKLGENEQTGEGESGAEPGAEPDAEPGAKPQTLNFELAEEARRGPKIGLATPRALIPVFPGTNCEYDTARALRRAGAEAEILVLQNLTPQQVDESAAAMSEAIRRSQMLVLSGGFSAGDEPEGSAKLICAFLRGAAVAEAVTELLEQRDGLVLGICNGFQALVKLGLLPYGRILGAGEAAEAAERPTLTFNTIGRHQNRLVRTRVASHLSPWLWKEPVGSIHTIAVSHGEGRFVAPATQLKQLAASGQIATQYVGYDGQATMEMPHNPNGSLLAVEGLCSPDGRVLGKMGHTERSGQNLYINVPGNKEQLLFESGVGYFAL